MTALSTYPATTQVPQAPDHTDINKAVLDLLSKVNGLSLESNTALTTQGADITASQGDITTLESEVTALQNTVASITAPATVLTGLPSASAVALLTGVPTNVLTFLLGAGTWDISGAAGFVIAAGTTVLSVIRYGISTTSATFNSASGEAPMTIGDVSFRVPTYGTQVQEDNPWSASIPSYRVKLAVATTIWLVSQATFSAGTVSGFGWVQAVQVVKGIPE